MVRLPIFVKSVLASLLVLALLGPAGIPARSKAGARSGTPAFFYVFLQDDNGDPFDGMDSDIQGYDWPFDTAVTLTIDLHSTTQNPDYTFSPTGSEDEGGGLIHVYFPKVTVYPEDVVTMSNGLTTLTYTLTPLAVTGMDVAGAAVSGTAAPGSLVEVLLREPYNLIRNETAGLDGTWTADFSVPGDEPVETGTAPFTPGTYMFVSQSSGGQTQAYELQVPDPSFYIWLESWGDPDNGIHFDVHGYDWQLFDTPVSLTIDKLDTPTNPDYTLVESMEVPPWGGDPMLVFDTGSLSVHTGDTFRMTDGTYTIDHTLTSLTASGYDVAARTFAGTAAPGSVVDVSLEGSNVIRHVKAGPGGTWTADFGVPGPLLDENTTTVLAPGSKFQIGKSNPGNPAAVNAYGITITSPYIEARPGPDWIRAWNWPPGASLTLLIDDPATLQPVDYSDTGVAAGGDPCGNPDCTSALFDLGDFDLQPRFIVAIWSGTDVKSYVVADLGATDVDFGADTISGYGAPGHSLQVCVYVEGPFVCRWFTVASTGAWTVDFHNPGPDPGEEYTTDLRPGSSGWMADTEEDGDVTNCGWATNYEIYLPLLAKN